MEDTLLNYRISGTPRARFLLELFGNTAIFPIANVVFELLVEGAGYLRAPDLYIIFTTTVIQAACLSRWEDSARPRRFLGNLIAPALYTLAEGLREGPQFFAAPRHLVYWVIALVIGGLQAIGPRLPGGPAAFALLLENIARASILLVMYGLFEMETNPTQTVSLQAFFGDSSHQFIAAFTFLLGLGTGLANLTARRRQALLQQTSAQLQRYSEWLLGRSLLNRIVANPDSLALTRQERSILFMDIRGFTQWSDARSPEAVARLLNDYYYLAEQVFAAHQPVKYKFVADEVMAVFADAEGAVAAASELSAAAGRLLAGHSLGVGIGLHTGALVEGLLGSSTVKFYDVIGDTVNVAKRIESNAQSGEILLSEAARAGLTQPHRLDGPHEIFVKGKAEALLVYRLD